MTPALPALALESHGQAPALFEPDGRTTSFHELAQLADAAALPFGPRRTLVAVLAANRRDALAGFLGAQRAGHAVLLLDGAGGAPSNQALLEAYRPAFLWKPDAAGVWGAEAFSSDPPALHPDLALLMPTSGSTGSPKLVRLSARAVAANAASIGQYLPCGQGERAITSLPFHYAYGLSVVHSHLLAGGALLLTQEGVMSGDFWRFFKGMEATSLAGVPYTYEMLRKLGIDRRKPESLRTLTQAGGRLSEADIRHWAQVAQGWEAQFHVMYGQTEATARIACLPPAHLPTKAGGIGQAIPGGLLRLVEDELVYAGPNVMMGYAEKAEDLARGDDLGGVLHTGDLGRVDGDGCFFITGRRKRFLKMAGVRVGLDELEAALKSLGFSCACTGADNALVVAVENAAEDAPQTLALLLHERFHIHPAFVSVKPMAALPRSNSGKIQYGAL